MLAPTSALKASRYDWPHHQFVDLLQNDLNRLSAGHPDSLTGDIQCIDSISGCIETLYRLHLLQSSRVLYDEFLFYSANEQAVAVSRSHFWADMQNRPKIIVMSSPSFPVGPMDYEKIKLWPDFQLWLESYYRLETDRTPTFKVQSVGRSYFPPGYRIYVRRDEYSSTTP